MVFVLSLVCNCSLLFFKEPERFLVKQMLKKLQWQSSFLLMLIMGLMIFKECFHVMFIQGNQKHNYCAEGHSQDLKHRWKLIITSSLFLQVFLRQQIRIFQTNANVFVFCFHLILVFGEFVYFWYFPGKFNSEFSFYWICLFLEFSRKIHEFSLFNHRKF